jgi:hypothetical protein
VARTGAPARCGLRGCGGSVGVGHDTPAKTFLIVDGHPVHRASAVHDFVADTDGRLRLFFLPGYSPELNPDE